MAVARLGREVAMFGSVGNDTNGSSKREVISKEKVDASGYHTTESEVTEVAFMKEISEGDNQIVVISRANSYTKKSSIQKTEKLITEYDALFFN